MADLSATLAKITGSSGTASFSAEGMNSDRALFVVAKSSKGIPLGCGAIRPISDETAELKRMYSVPTSKGVGSAILEYLEQSARELGYTNIVLETRKINQKAVAFYMSKGYVSTDNYGRYVGNELAVCFIKPLT